MTKLNHILAIKVKNQLFFGIIVIAYTVMFFILLVNVLPNIEFSSSPDGQVARIFTERIQSKGEFVIPYPDDIPSELAQYIVPRSTRYQEAIHAYSMSSYYGLPVFYSLANSFLSYYIIFFLTAFLLLITFFLLLKKITSSIRISFYATLFIGLQPVFLFYAFRGLMHNILFVFILMLSVLFLLNFSTEKKQKVIFLSGILLGFAGAVRMNELVWIAPLFLILLFQSRQLTVKNLLSLFLGFLLGIAPFIAISKEISSSYVQYIQLNQESVTSNSLLKTLKGMIFPFGLDFSNTFKMFALYIRELWYFYLPMWGLIFILAYKQKYFTLGVFRNFLVKISFLLLILFFLLYYGSSSFGANNDSYSITASHMRYWLPLMFVHLVLLAFLLKKVTNKTTIVVFVALLIIVGNSVVFLNGNSFQNLFIENSVSKLRFDNVNEIIDGRSILLAGRADKYFLGTGIVAGTRMHTKREDFVKQLLLYKTDRTTYYYHVDADISSHWTKDALEEAGVTFEYVAQFHDGGNAWEYLYKLDWPNKE